MIIGDIVEVVFDTDQSGNVKYKTKIGSFGVIKEVRGTGFVITFEYINGCTDYTVPINLHVNMEDCQLKGKIISAEDMKLKAGETLKIRGIKDIFKFIKFKDANKRFLVCSSILFPELPAKEFHISAIVARPKLKAETTKWICTKGKSTEDYYWFKYKLAPEYKVKVMRTETPNLRSILIQHEKIARAKHFGNKEARTYPAPIGKSKYVAEYIGKEGAKVHAKAGTFADIIAERYIKSMDTVKIPTEAKKNYIGVEIECYTKLSRKELGKEFIKARLFNDVSLVGDGSIGQVKAGYEPIEVRVLCNEDNRVDILTRVCKVLELADAQTNKTCGLHVHLDMRNRNYKEVFKNLFHAQKTMFAIQPANRQWNDYAMRCMSEDVEVEKHVAIGGRSGRYKAINIEAYSEHKTLEIRLHEGTAVYADIINWVDFLIDVINAEPIKYTRDTHAELFSLIKSREDTVSFLTKRIEKYRDENAKVKYKQ